MPQIQFPLPSTFYIDDGYSMIRTDAPKDLGGRLFRNCARTTPELPVKCVSTPSNPYTKRHTMWPRHLAPDDPDLGSSDFPLCAVDECDLLAKVEAVRGQSMSECSRGASYLAAFVSSTPSILIRLVPGVVLRLPRW